jgi:type I restriction enzyme S subunit
MIKWRKVEDLLIYSGKGITPKYVEESSIIVLNQKCIRNHKIDYTFSRFTNDTKTINPDKFIQKGDILFNSTGQGTAGRCAFVDWLPEKKKVITDSHILVLRIENYFEAQCLSYSFHSKEKEIMSFMDGSTGQGELDKIRVFNLLTSLSENSKTQKQIAKVLSYLDAKIKINNKINQELEAMAKTLYDYWFVQFDFPDKNEKPYKSSGGNMVFNEELKREIPDGWEVKQLIDLCIRIGDGLHGTPKYVEKSDYSFINGNNLKNGFISTDNDTKKVSSQEYEKHFIQLNNNSILLSINGTLGNLAIYNNEKVMLGKSSAYINCKENHRTYCYEYLNQSHMKKVFWNIATGSTIKNLGLESIKKLIILEPNNNLIEKFDELTKSIENKRINIFKQNQKLSELRDWLLPMLMNGQVTVGDAEQEVESLGLVTEEDVKYGNK